MSPKSQTHEDIGTKIHKLFTRRQYRVWMLLLAVQLICLMALEMSASLWNIYIKQQLPLQSSAQLSVLSALVYTLPPLLSIVSIPFWGRLGDSYGHRKMIIWTLIALFISEILVGISTSIWAVVVARVIQGIFAGFLTAQQAYALGFTDRFWKKQTAGNVIAQLQMVTALAGIIGASLGGVLMQYLGFQTMVTISGFMCLVALVPVLFLPSDSRYRRTKAVKHKSPDKKQKGPAVITLTILTVFLMMALIHIAKTTERPFFGPYVYEIKNMSTGWVGYFASAHGLGLIVSAPLWMMLVNSNKKRMFAVMFVAAVLSSLIYIAINNSSSEFSVLALRFAWGCCRGALMPVAMTLCTMLSKTQNYGFLLGMATSAVRIGGTGGLLLGSALLSVIPIKDGLYVVSGLYALAALAIATVFLVFRRKGVI